MKMQAHGQSSIESKREGLRADNRFQSSIIGLSDEFPKRGRLAWCHSKLGWQVVLNTQGTIMAAIVIGDYYILMSYFATLFCFVNSGGASTQRLPPVFPGSSACHRRC